MKKNFLITGGAGFLGCNLTLKLIKDGHQVTIIDDFRTGKRENLKEIDSKLKIYDRDLLGHLEDSIFENIDCVIHLAANADIRDGFLDTSKDIKQNIIVTEKLIKKVNSFKIKDFIFSSTAAIYGEPKVFPTPENIEIPIQTSLYGTSKLAAEGILSSYAMKYDLRVSIFRFVSIVGDFYSHGHIIDFFNKLKKNPDELEILGNGLQKKSYLHVNDMLDGIKLVIEKKHFSKKSFFEIYNIGNDEYCTVNESAKIICDQMLVKPKFVYTGGIRGWVGDSPFVFLDTTKIKKLGWTPNIIISDAIKKTISWLIKNDK
jgi:UDP-glucose 4-epimerase